MRRNGGLGMYHPFHILNTMKYLEVFPHLSNIPDYLDSDSKVLILRLFAKYRVKLQKCDSCSAPVQGVTSLTLARPLLLTIKQTDKS